MQTFFRGAGPGEVRIRIAASGINPVRYQKRQDAFGYGVQNPRVIPHSDGSGQVDHVVEVAFGAKIDTDVELLKMRGSIAAYATDNATPKIPLWLMAFKNIRLFFLGSEDFPKEAKISATQDLNAAIQRGWQGFEIAERIPLSEIARAHELAEHSVQRGRVVVIV